MFKLCLFILEKTDLYGSQINKKWKNGFLALTFLFSISSCSTLQIGPDSKTKTTTQKLVTPGKSGQKKKPHPHGAPPGQKKKKAGHPGKKHG